MRKYVYFNNKIYETNKFNFENENAIHDCIYLTRNGILTARRYFVDTNCTEANKSEWVIYEDWVDNFDSKFKAFDNFEDIIEVGDLIRYNEPPNNETIFEIKNEYALLLCNSILKDNLTEIWKRIGNTFIKVCYKENDEWVIN